MLQVIHQEKKKPTLQVRALAIMSRQSRSATVGSYTLPSHLDGDGRRLNQQHEVFQLRFSSNLITTKSLPADFSGTVLDIGTGTGIWAAEFAAKYPASSVLGIDLFAPSITPVPANCRFQVLNIEDIDDDGKRLPHGTFDIIHTRMVFCVLRHGRKVLQMCFHALKPGGFVEFQEKQDPYRSDDPSAEAQDTPVLRHGRLRTKAAMNCGLDRAVANKVPGWMREMGFSGVQVNEWKIPIGEWMDGRDMKVAGEKFKECLEWGTLGICKSVFIEGLGWSEHQVLHNVKDTVEDLGNGRVYMLVLVISGTKA
ncbi:sam dependent methyltransferase [Rhypophila decipiens]